MAIAPSLFGGEMFIFFKAFWIRYFSLMLFVQVFNYFTEEVERSITSW